MFSAMVLALWGGSLGSIPIYLNLTRRCSPELPLSCLRLVLYSGKSVVFKIYWPKSTGGTETGSAETLEAQLQGTAGGHRGKQGQGQM